MNRLTYKYSKLFTLGVEQLYYLNRVGPAFKADPSNDFIIVPSQETAAFMKRKDYLLKADAGIAGFSVYGQVSGTNGGGDELLRFRVQKEDKLVFLLMMRNISLVNFNDLPTDLSIDKVYYFSNDIDDALATRANLHLSKDPAGVKLADTIKKSFALYSFHHNSPILAGTAKVKHVLSGTEVQPSGLINQGGQADLSFQLLGLPIGRCELLINNLLTEQFYYLGPVPLPSVFGVVEISLDKAIKANYRVVEADFSLTGERPFYRILIANRPTRWRYRIRLESTSPLYLEIDSLAEPARTDFINDINITTNGAISFTRDSFAGNEFVFVSDNPVLLREKYLTAAGKTLQVTLKKNLSTAGDTVRDYLPYPSSRMIDASQLPDIYSDIFLTI